ncbi:M28 family peptidase [Fibrobacterota bacterium]
MPVLVFILLMVCPPAESSSRSSHPEIPADRDRMYGHVEVLSSVSPPRNFANLESLNSVADYISAKFKSLYARVDSQNYKAGENQYRNIICSFGPETGERIIVGAHYDVAGSQPGADDNASGVAGLLEIARLLDSLKPDLKYRVDLAAYTLEEPPFYRTDLMGSAVHAWSLSHAGVQVRAMICLEMIGFFTEENSQEYPAFFLDWMYPKRGNFIAVVGKWGQGDLVDHMEAFMKQGSNIDVQSLCAPRLLPAIDLSDHLNFWNRGYPAVMITDTANYRNPNYHNITDTIDTLDFEKMAEVVKGVYWALVNL